MDNNSISLSNLNYHRECKTPQLNNLPYPVHCLIASYLDSHSLIKISHLNKYWNVLASKDKIWDKNCIPTNVENEKKSKRTIFIDSFKEKHRNNLEKEKDEKIRHEIKEKNKQLKWWSLYCFYYFQNCHTIFCFGFNLFLFVLLLGLYLDNYITSSFGAFFPLIYYFLLFIFFNSAYIYILWRDYFNRMYQDDELTCCNRDMARKFLFFDFWYDEIGSKSKKFIAITTIMVISFFVFLFLLAIDIELHYLDSPLSFPYYYVFIFFFISLISTFFLIKATPNNPISYFVNKPLYIFITGFIAFSILMLIYLEYPDSFDQFYLAFPFILSFFLAFFYLCIPSCFRLTKALWNDQFNNFDEFEEGIASVLLCVFCIPINVFLIILTCQFAGVIDTYYSLLLLPFLIPACCMCTGCISLIFEMLDDY